ncbi:MAG: hypothetical protein KAJ51_15020 [Thermoplasmata archaeon]|nr:hypothetical protein [Thermoplasmata archaeon]
MGVLILIIACFCGCTEEDDDDNENGGGGEGESESEGEGFQLYEDGFDWRDANENSKPMTGLEVIELAMANIEILAPGTHLGVMSSTEFKGEGANITTGKAIAWQFYLFKTVNDTYMDIIINVAENGGYIVKDYKESVDDYNWDYKSAVIDTDDLPGILADHQETQDWLADHPDATLDIQTSSGIPFFGEKELSWLMWYQDGSDMHQVHISALDGHILE